MTVALLTAFVLLAQPACALGAKCFMQDAAPAAATEFSSTPSQEVLPPCHATPPTDPGPMHPERSRESDPGNCCEGTDVAAEAPKTAPKGEGLLHELVVDTTAGVSATASSQVASPAGRGRSPGLGSAWDADPGSGCGGAVALFTLHSILII